MGYNQREMEIHRQELSEFEATRTNYHRDCVSKYTPQFLTSSQFYWPRLSACYACRNHAPCHFRVPPADFDVSMLSPHQSFEFQTRLLVHLLKTVL
jgi:hypothetical protein